MKIAVGPGYEALTGAGSLFLGVDLERAGSMWICVNVDKEVFVNMEILSCYIGINTLARARGARTRLERLCSENVMGHAH